MKSLIVLCLLAVVSNSFPIYVNTLTGRTIELEVSSTDSVLSIKKKMDDIPVGKQRIIFKGEELNDFLRLVDYNVGEGSVVSMLMRP